MTGTPEFRPFPGLANGHLMTIAPAFWPRSLRFARERGEERLFEVEPAVHVLTRCHWQERRKASPVIILLHGLEGSSESHFILGTAEKAFQRGFSVVRMNHRNCGGSLHLTHTLYNSGLSADPIAVARELAQEDGISDIFIAGWSLGGNVVLKAAAELSLAGSRLVSGVCAVSPSLDLHACVSELERGFNRFYQRWFLRGLKSKIAEKNTIYPELYDTRPLPSIKSIRQFDDTYTAPLSGYGTADTYYTKASALDMADRITIPAMVLHAEDDPFVPVSSFRSEKLTGGPIRLLITKHGGHAGYIAAASEPGSDRFWAENRVIDFAAQLAFASRSAT